MMQSSRLLWPTLEEARQRQDLMDRMMQIRGVDVLTVLGVDGGLAFIEARAKCRYCLHEEVCRRWLATEAPRTPPYFCPNAAFFLSCLSMNRAGNRYRSGYPQAPSRQAP
jgi:hypothetical protein